MSRRSIFAETTQGPYCFDADTMLMKVTQDGDGYLAVLVLAADSDADGS